MEPPEAASLPEEAEFVLEPPPCEGEALAEAALGAAAAEGAADVETEAAAVGDFGDALEGLLRPGGWRGAARRGVGLVADGYLALLARMDAAGEGAADALGLQREHHREIAVRVMRLLPLFLLTQVMVVFSLVYAVRGSLRHTSGAKAARQAASGEAGAGTDTSTPASPKSRARPARAKAVSPKSKKQETPARAAEGGDRGDEDGGANGLKWTDLAGVGRKTAERLAALGWASPSAAATAYATLGEDGFRARLKDGGVTRGYVGAVLDSVR